MPRVETWRPCTGCASYRYRRLETTNGGVVRWWVITSTGTTNRSAASNITQTKDEDTRTRRRYIPYRLSTVSRSTTTRRLPARATTHKKITTKHVCIRLSCLAVMTHNHGCGGDDRERPRGVRSVEIRHPIHATGHVTRKVRPHLMWG